MSDCPTESRVLRWLAGELGDESGLHVQRHADECRECQRRVHNLEREHADLIGILRQIHVTSEAHTTVGMLHGSRRAQPEFTLKNYLILREISRGGQGVVYEAYQQSTKRRVAIKVLLDFGSSHAARMRFLREIELVAQMNHPNIVKVFDSGQTERGAHFLVMDLVDGDRIDQYVRTHRLTIDETLVLFRQVCAGVSAAHQHGIIHRDLKPGNILVDKSGLVRILDFGLAKSLTSSDNAFRTLDQMVVGTLPYMSPEQARGDQTAMDTRTDVYSLGVILYELLTGHFPYPVVGELGAVLRAIAECEPTPPNSWLGKTSLASRLLRRRSRWLPTDLVTILLKCLAKQKGRRYQSVGELLHDISLYLDGQPIAARRDSLWYVLSKLAIRNAYATAVVVTVAIITLGFVIILAHNHQSTKRALEAERLASAQLGEMNIQAEKIADGMRAATRRMAFGYFLMATLQPNDILADDMRRSFAESSNERLVADWLLDGNCAESGTLPVLASRDRGLSLLAKAVCLDRAGAQRAAKTALDEAKGAGADSWLSELVAGSLGDDEPADD